MVECRELLDQSKGYIDNSIRKLYFKKADKS